MSLQSIHCWVKHMPSYLFSLFIMGEQGIFSVPFFRTSSVTTSLFSYICFDLFAVDGNRVLWVFFFVMLRSEHDQSIRWIWFVFSSVQSTYTRSYTPFCSSRSSIRIRTFSLSSLFSSCLDSPDCGILDRTMLSLIFLCRL